MDGISISMNTEAERDSQGKLLYPEQRFAVWRDAAEGVAQPYLVDQHTFRRITEALNFACAWMHQQVGNQAIVYLRGSQRLLAHYYQAPDGQCGCLLYSLDGQRLRYATRASLLKNVTWATERPTIAETFQPLTADLKIYWERYRSARNSLVRVLREQGDEVGPQERLADLLKRYQLLLSNTSHHDPEDEMGEIAFDPACPFYDSRKVQEVLFALAPILPYQSNVTALVGGRHVLWRLRDGVLFSRGGWAIEATDLEKQDRKQQKMPSLTLEHPDGEHIEITSYEDYTCVVLDMFLYSLLFERDADRFDSLPTTDESYAVQRERSLERAVPTPDQSDALRMLLDLSPAFFPLQAQNSQVEAPSLAQVISSTLRAWVDQLYREHREALLTQARSLTAQDA